MDPPRESESVDCNADAMFSIILARQRDRMPATKSNEFLKCPKRKRHRKHRR
jgi:hypothetical protein